MVSERSWSSGLMSLGRNSFGPLFFGLKVLACLAVSLAVGPVVAGEGPKPSELTGQAASAPLPPEDALPLLTTKEVDPLLLRRTELFIQRFVQRRAELAEPKDPFDSPSWSGITEPQVFRRRSQSQVAQQAEPLQQDSEAVGPAQPHVPEKRVDSPDDQPQPLAKPTATSTRPAPWIPPEEELVLEQPPGKRPSQPAETSVEEAEPIKEAKVASSGEIARAPGSQPGPSQDGSSPPSPGQSPVPQQAKVASAPSNAMVPGTGPKDSGPKDSGPKDSGAKDLGAKGSGAKGSGAKDSGAHRFVAEQPLEGGSSGKAADRPQLASDDAATLASRRDELLSRVARGLTVEVAGPHRVSLGEPAEYSLIVRNRGNMVSQPAILEVGLPDEATLLRERPIFDQGKHRWNVAPIRPGESQRFQVSFACHRAGQVGLEGRLAVPQVSVHQFEVLAGKLSLVAAEQVRVRVGSPDTLVFVVRNSGRAVARDVEVQLRLPDSLRPGERPARVVRVGNLEPGEHRRIEVAVKPQGSGTVEAVVVAQAAGGVQTQAVQEVVILAPKLSVEPTGPEKLRLGEIETFIVQLTNEGTLPLKKVTVITALSEELRLVDAETGARVDPSMRLFGWDLAELPPGQTKTLRWWATARREGRGLQQVFVEAEGGLRYETSLSTELKAIPQVVLEVEDHQGPVSVGDEVIYRVRMANHGRTDAKELVLHGELPKGLRPLTPEGAAGQTWDGNRVTFATVGRLSPGEVRWFQVRAEARQPGRPAFQLRLTGQGEEITRTRAEQVVRQTKSPLRR